jgi:uncharacterized protein (DUF2147 family)
LDKNDPKLSKMSHFTEGGKIFSKHFFSSLKHFISMKNTSSNTTKWIYRFLTIASVFTLTLVACRKDTTLPEQSFDQESVADIANTTLDMAAVNDAKSWFTQQALSKSLGNIDAVGLTLQWADAQTYGSRVEVPVLFKGKMSRLTTEKNDTSHLGKKRLVFNKKGDGKYDSYLVDYIPSKNFKGNLKNINDVNFTQLKFDGKVLISTLDNNPIGMYVIKNGEKSLYYKAIKKSDRNDLQLRDGRWYCEYIYELHCEIIGEDTPGGVQWHCEIYLQDYCYWIEDTLNPCQLPFPLSSCRYQ